MTLVSSLAFSCRAISAQILASFSASGESHSKAIAHGDLCRLQRFWRYVFVIEIGHEPGELCGDVHNFLRLIVQDFSRLFDHFGRLAQNLFEQGFELFARRVFDIHSALLRFGQ